jgi:hypothetical protein
MDDVLIELPRSRNFPSRVPPAGVCASSSATTENLPWWVDDEPSIASICRRPGWLWIGYMAFGIAFWAGLGFAIRAFLVVI